MKKISNFKFTQIQGLLNKDYNSNDIADILGVKPSTARRYIRFVKNYSVEEAKVTKYSYPKILLIDIETLPMEILVWALYKQRPSYEQVIKDWCILSYSAKWLFDDKIYRDVISPDEAIKREDTSIIQGLWDLINEADIIIAHNGLRFDMRKINARFMLNNMMPPSRYQVIDTLKHAQKIAAFSSHKLNDLLSMLDLSAKIKTEYDLWKRCAGLNVTRKQHVDALREMLNYNINDVKILEDLYVELRPWIFPHPNLGLFDTSNISCCPSCGSTDITWKGYYYTSAGRYKTFRCNDCNSQGRSRYSDLSKEERKNLTVGLAR